MREPIPGEETAEAVRDRVKGAAANRKKNSSYKAKADLEEDVERLNSALNTERFLIVVGVLIAFDAWIFTYYHSWAAPICLVAIEFAGLFVLARYLEVIEIVYFAIDIVRSWGSRDRDPGDNDEPGG